jgi:hypothetical protein
MEQASAPSRAGHGITRPDPFDYSLDRALERLRVHGLPYRGDPKHFNCWSAVCPFCRVPAWTLTLREHGRRGAIGLICAAGCTCAEIHAALEREPAEARIEAAEAKTAEVLDLAEQAREVAARALELAADGPGEPSSKRPWATA